MKNLLLVLCGCFFIFSVIGQAKSDELLVFVGKKISLTKLRKATAKRDISINNGDTLKIIKLINNKSSATYKVHEIVYGDFTDDTITFTVYHEFKNLNFAKHENVLLFLEKKKSGAFVYLLPYFFDVYQTQEGKWASDYSLPQWVSDDFTVKSEQIPFKKSIAFDVGDRDKEYIKEHYPEPYYEIQGDKAIPIYGIYVDDLFKIMKQEKLKGKGYFNMK